MTSTIEEALQRRGMVANTVEAQSSTKYFLSADFFFTSSTFGPSQKIFLLVLIIPFPAENPVGGHPGDSIYAYCTCIFGEK